MSKKNWIAGAVKNPGSLTRTAKKAGAVKKGGGIKSDWLNKEAKGSGVTAKRARLAKTLKKLGK